MRLTYFNEIVVQPDDSPYDAWVEKFGDVPGENDLSAIFVEDDDGIWGCTLTGADGELEVNDFNSREDLLEWLREHDIPHDDG